MSLEMRYSLAAFETDSSTGQTERTGEDVVLVFESVLSVDARAKSVITKYAVELGAPRADHKRDEGLSLSIRVSVSDHVLGDVPATGSRTRASAWSLRTLDLGDGLSLAVWQHDEKPTRVRDVLDELDTLRRTATDIVVVHEDDAWSRMQVVDVSAPRTAKEGDAREIQITLEQVRTATVSTVDAPEPRVPRARRGDRRGDQSTTDVPGEQQEAVSRSFLDSILGG